MIIINNTNIIEKVVINNTTLEQTHFDINGKEIKKIISKDIFSSNEIPFIEIPLFDSNTCETIIVCKTGYIDKNTNKQDYCHIKIKNVEIESIKVKVKSSLFESDFTKNYCLKISFEYEIKIKIIDFNKKYKTYTLNKKIVQEKRNLYSKKICYTVPSAVINCLIKDIIPILNEYVDSHNPIKHINFSYIESLFNDKNVHPFEFSDALNIIYELKINEQYIEFGKDLEPYMNNYIVSLIDSILGCNLKYNYQLHTYTTIIPNIAEKIFISKEKYIKCLLFLGIYANYNKDMAKKNFLILPYNKIDFNDFVHICPDRKIQEIFDFILDMETTHTQEGQYRVGRDDREWKEVTFILPDKNLTDTNKDKLITDINKILKIKLEYVTTDKIYLPNKENYKEIFYYREIYDAEYVSGMACSSYDINSIELKKNSFFKLLDNFVRHYLYAKRKWCYHTHSWSRSISWNDNKKYKYDLHFD